MDLLFKRYASPFLLLDNYIRTQRFFEFVENFIDLQNEDDLWNYYLHKPIDKSYDEFKNSVNRNNEQVTEEQIETTILNSKDTLNDFIPKKGRG